MARRMNAREITPASFKGFGTVISPEARKPDGGDGVNFTWWERFGAFTGVAVSVNLLGCTKRALMVTRLESHARTEEVILPLGGEDMILPLAPAGAMDEERVTAFLLRGDMGVILDTGVWHFIPYPLEKTATCVIVFKDATGANDIVFHELGLPVELVP